MTESTAQQLLPRGAYPGADLRRGLSGRLRRALGIRRSFRVAGVRYKEVSSEPLRVALSRRGRGHKDYDVSFRTGERMRIRCTAERPYADLVPPPTLPAFLRAERLLRPGMRVLITPCGTGYAPAMIAGRVAPSGAVVAIDADVESIEFARHRYPFPGVSFESGGAQELAGETDGAFDAALCVVRNEADLTDSLIAELWRLVGLNGWLLAAYTIDPPTPELGRAATERLTSLLTRLCNGSEPNRSTSNIGALGDGRDGWIVAVAHHHER